MEITISRVIGTKDSNYLYIPDVIKSKSNVEKEAIRFANRFHDDRLIITDNGKHGYINSNGQKVIDLKYDKAYDFKDGFAIVGKNGKKGIGYGMIDLNGKEIIKPIYTEVKEFCEGIAIVRNNKMKYIAINNTGKKITKKQYDCIFDFNEGFARVREGCYVGFIDKEGNEVIPLIYDDAESYRNGYAIVEKKAEYPHIDRNRGMIDVHGNLIIFPKYRKLTRFKENRCSGINQEGKYVIFDINGEIIKTTDYDYIGQYRNGIAIVKKNDKYGFIDLNGNEVAAPIYEDIWYGNDGNLYRFKLNNKYGILDSNGNVIIEALYDSVCVEEDYIIVKNINKYGLITRTGKIIADCVYADISLYDNYIEFCFLLSTSREYIEIPKSEMSFNILIEYKDKMIERKFDTIEEQEKYYELLRVEVDNQNAIFKEKRLELERKLIEEEDSIFNNLKEKVKTINSEAV